MIKIVPNMRPNVSKSLLKVSQIIKPPIKPKLNIQAQYSKPRKMTSSHDIYFGGMLSNYRRSIQYFLDKLISLNTSAPQAIACSHGIVSKSITARESLYAYTHMTLAMNLKSLSVVTDVATNHVRTSNNLSCSAAILISIAIRRPLDIGFLHVAFPYGCPTLT